LQKRGGRKSSIAVVVGVRLSVRRGVLVLVFLLMGVRLRRQHLPPLRVANRLAVRLTPRGPRGPR